MIIKEVLQQLDTATHPVAKALYKTDGCKILVIAFKKGMLLKEHQTAVGGKLTILEGCVTYIEGDKNIELNKYDETIIPAKTIHAVQALEDSLCLITL
jgi:quercetin dioxygenase-like cupin family protein